MTIRKNLSSLLPSTNGRRRTQSLLFLSPLIINMPAHCSSLWNQRREKVDFQDNPLVREEAKASLKRSFESSMCIVKNSTQPDQSVLLEWNALFYDDESSSSSSLLSSSSSSFHSAQVHTIDESFPSLSAWMKEQDDDADDEFGFDITLRPTRPITTAAATIVTATISTQRTNIHTVPRGATLIPQDCAFGMRHNHPNFYSCGGKRQKLFRPLASSCGGDNTVTKRGMVRSKAFRFGLSSLIVDWEPNIQTSPKPHTRQWCLISSLTVLIGP